MVCRISGKLHQSRIVAKQVMHAKDICNERKHSAGLEVGEGRDVEVGMVTVDCGVSFARSRQGQARRADWYRIPTKSEIYTALGNARVR